MKNRVIKTVIEDFESWDNGKVTEKYIKRYEELSKLEMGTIITGCIMIEPTDVLPVPVIDKDEYISEFKKLVDVVHKNGANIIAQISFVKDFDLPVEEIHKLKDFFADAALRAKKAGFDGIEIGAGHVEY